MALAGSATDCLKRCFRQLGEQFGNLLYDKEIAQNAGLDQNRSNGTSASKANSSASTTSIVRKYGDGVSVNGNVSEQEAFDQFKEKTGRVPATKDELRNWLTSQRATPTPASVAA
jgi:recombination DNA repair RAD52 pathway protein